MRIKSNITRINSDENKISEYYENKLEIWE